MLAVVGALLAVINVALKPLIKLLTFPLYIVTLGLFSLVVNGILLLIVSWISVSGDIPFIVRGFWAAVVAALIISLVSWILHIVIPEPDSHRK